MASTFNPDYIAKYTEADVESGAVGSDGKIVFGAGVIPAFDPEEDEGKVLGISDGKLAWIAAE